MKNGSDSNKPSGGLSQWEFAELFNALELDIDDVVAEAANVVTVEKSELFYVDTDDQGPPGLSQTLDQPLSLRFGMPLRWDNGSANADAVDLARRRSRRNISLIVSVRVPDTPIMALFVVIRTY